MSGSRPIMTNSVVPIPRPPNARGTRCFFKALIYIRLFHNLQHKDTKRPSKNLRNRKVSLIFTNHQPGGAHAPHLFTKNLLTMKTTKILYWVFTILMIALMLSSVIGSFMNNPKSAEFAAHLGYPLYIFKFLAVAKALGIIAILVPGNPR